MNKGKNKNEVYKISASTINVANGLKLERLNLTSRIFYYRDGVSEGQFAEVLLVELKAIQEACMSLPGDYRPGIIFMLIFKF